MIPIITKNYGFLSEDEIAGLEHAMRDVEAGIRQEDYPDIKDLPYYSIKQNDLGETEVDFANGFDELLNEMI